MSEAKFTQMPWKVEHMGGASTVLVPVRPRYNNTATPSYGYRDGGPFCVATIFQEDGGHIRRDFVTFSHDDAHLIAAAPELYEALRMAAKDLHTAACMISPEINPALFETVKRAEAALAKARGEA